MGLRVMTPPSWTHSFPFLGVRKSSSIPMLPVQWCIYISAAIKLTSWALSSPLPCITYARKTSGQPHKTALSGKSSCEGSKNILAHQYSWKKTLLTGVKMIPRTIQLFSLFMLTLWMLASLALAQLPTTTDMQEESSCTSLVKCLLKRSIQVLQSSYMLMKCHCNLPQKKITTAKFYCSSIFRLLPSIYIFHV